MIEHHQAAMAHAAWIIDLGPGAGHDGGRIVFQGLRSDGRRSGERQRLKLATEMGESGGIYVLDEPTTGLHLADLQQFLGLLDRLVDAGKSIIVIEHHQAVMARRLDHRPGPRRRP